MIRGKTLRRVAATLAAIFVILPAAPAFAGGSLVWALLIPGLGQAQNGHYTKASVLGTAGVISWTGLFATQINYSRSVDQYENQKDIYLSYQDQLDAGSTVYIGDVNDTYAQMSSAYSKAEDDEQWRNVFVGALIVTYALNTVDILMSSKEDTGEVERDADTSLEWRNGEFRLVRTVRF
jgi:hypothetical protein